MRVRAHVASLVCLSGMIGAFAVWWAEDGSGQQGGKIRPVGILAVGRHMVTALPLLFCCPVLLVFAWWCWRERLRPVAPTLLVVLSALLAFGAFWWLNDAPGREGRVLWKISEHHGLVEHDLPALPVGVAAVIFGVLGLVTTWRRLNPRIVPEAGRRRIVDL